MYDISIHGLGNHTIKHDLSDISSNLPTWNDLIPLRDIIPSLPDYHLLCSNVEDISGNSWLPAYQWDALLSTGTYGKVYKGSRVVYTRIDKKTQNIATEGSSQFCISGDVENIVLKEIPIQSNLKQKEYLEAIQAILYEGTIHSLVVQYFSRIEWSFAVPKLYEIFARGAQKITSYRDVKEIVFCMEYIRGRTLYDFLRNQFVKEQSTRNDILYLRILAEIALQLSLVQKNLRLNHRDMKVNNVLIRKKKPDHGPVFSRFYPALSPFDNFQFNVVLIDYGFACIACGEPHDPPEVSLLEAGSWFGKTDSCFKQGRDLAQFIFCMECFFPSASYFTQSMSSIIKKWLTISYSGGTANLMNGVEIDGKPNIEPKPLVFDTGIYEFLRREEVNPNHCSPQYILEDISSYYIRHGINIKPS
jgi:serine/threonine protein kinase